VTQLIDALTVFRGALLVVSHDRRFLEAVGIDVTLEVTGDGELRPVTEAEVSDTAAAATGS
jgi:ATPase subunit of ABC transporter with duplicated ATPase domains